MAAFRQGVVDSIGPVHDDLIEARVSCDGQEVVAYGWISMLGALVVGDRVVVNTTGIDLELGTGGNAFILWNLDGDDSVEAGEGHIVKLRYTPWQTEVAAVEAQESVHHELLVDATSIPGIPVVACGLHSQVASVAAGIKSGNPQARVGYLMTDGAALPLAWSHLVRDLKIKRLIDVTATSGHAFGGDLECVNVFSGMVALHHMGGVDAIVVSMGPGVVGTGTALGFTALEQGQVLDAVTALDGVAIASLRINFADERERHRGVSHHSLTALTVSAREPCAVVVPVLPQEQEAVVDEQLDRAQISDRHRIIKVDGAGALKELERLDVHPSSMGRSLEQVPELFLAGGAAGAYASALE